MANANLKLPLVAASVLALGLSSLSTEGFARGGAVIGGLIVGAAIGAAVSGAINQPKTIYVPAAPPPQPWPKTYSPKPGITCYPAQQACYNVNGAYNANWTWKVYAR